jgi:hypothetical protein
MPQSCTQMTMNGATITSLGQADQTMAGGGDSDSDLTGSGAGAFASMDCAQHCSNLGTTNLILGPAHHMADAPLAGGTSSFTLVFPDIDPSPPRPGTAS